MMHIIITDAQVKQWPISSSNRWVVVHPSNDAILAYCDTRAEAEHVRDAINDLARQLREVGCKVR